jgi:epoxyqueuosine reductase
LHTLADFVRSHCPSSSVRGVVDTAPLLEREFAQMAGLGWAGKNTLLLHPQAGSYFFLAAILTDQELEYDPPFTAEHCGTCRACLDACPTQAFPQPYVLDARRCISYLTIELRGPIPLEMREGIGDWLFGCDICQEVCPWNSKAPISTINAFEPRSDLWSVELSELFFLTEDQFRARFRATPLWRAKRQGVLRNAAIVLGNQRAGNAVKALRVGLVDGDPVIREACAWALSRLRLAEASLALREQQAIEPVDWVRDRLTDYLTCDPPHDA